MRIVTLNTWKNEGDYARRLDLMAGGLAALTPDVVCLQECFAGGGRDTAASLARALGLNGYARPARAKPRRHEGTMVASTSGLAMLSRLPAIAEGACVLASDPADGERIAQRLDLAVEGRRLRILNLHLTHLSGPDSARLRARQLTDALCWAGEGLAGGLVVAGDLNAGAADPALAALKARVGFEAATFLGSGAIGAARPSTTWFCRRQAAGASPLDFAPSTRSIPRAGSRAIMPPSSWTWPRLSVGRRLQPPVHAFCQDGALICYAW